MRYIVHRNLFVIDFFFLIGGILLSYVMIAKLAKSKGRFNYIQYAIFRYIRLMPPVILSIFAIYMLPLIMSGPIYKEVIKNFIDGCDVGWYQTILLWHNYRAAYPTPVLCNPPTWSLSADFHLYLIAPIVFLKMHSRPKVGFIYGIFGVIIGSILCLVPKYLGINSYYEWRTLESSEALTLAARHHFFGKFLIIEEKIEGNRLEVLQINLNEWSVIFKKKLIDCFRNSRTRVSIHDRTTTWIST